MTPRRMPARTGQRGSSLIFALIFLVILGMLGVTVASNNTLQERMAGNTRQRDVAFQAAEHALKTADLWMMTQTAASLEAQIAAGDPRIIDYSAGYSHANNRDYWNNTANWPVGSFDGSPPAPDTIDGTDTQPVYVIERMPDDGDGKKYFRVTARGVGKDTHAVVILQAMYRFD